MALYIPHSIFHLARLWYVRPETFGPYYVHGDSNKRLQPCCRSEFIPLQKMRAERQIQFQNFKKTQVYNFCISTLIYTDCSHMTVNKGTTLCYGSSVHKTLSSVNLPTVSHFSHNSTDPNHLIMTSSLPVPVAVLSKA